MTALILWLIVSVVAALVVGKILGILSEGDDR